MPRARFVHGMAAGQEVQVNDKYHRFARQLPIEAFDPAIANIKPAEIEYEEYEVHEFMFPTGHRHYYAAPTGVAPVGIFNEMWHGYKVTESLRNQVKELKEQNRRLEHELWRETFRNQFGKYPTE